MIPKALHKVLLEMSLLYIGWSGLLHHQTEYVSLLSHSLLICLTHLPFRESLAAGTCHWKHITSVPLEVKVFLVLILKKGKETHPEVMWDCGFGAQFLGKDMLSTILMPRLV